MREVWKRPIDLALRLTIALLTFFTDYYTKWLTPCRLAKRYTRKALKMASGTVKWFNSQKGFGFIAPDNGGADAFVHISAVERSGINELRDGQKVSYELVADRKSGKMSADNLKLI